MTAYKTAAKPQINELINQKNTIMAKFKVGDVVHLKSGGPTMTIESFLTAEMTGAMKFAYTHLKANYPQSEVFYVCRWFNDNNKLENSTFRKK